MSQTIQKYWSLGARPFSHHLMDEELPSEVVRSIEVDVAFMDDPNEEKSDKVDGAIGEDSLFHSTHGIYGQGVGISTATLPSGWEGRLVEFRSEETGDSRAVCLDAHDLVISKLVAGREKDFEFARALLTAGLIDLDTLKARAKLLADPAAIRQRVVRWLGRMGEP